MRVSVIIPHLNSLDTLSPQLEAILAQLPEDGEILVCDNGSAPEQKWWLHQLAAENVRVIDASAVRGPAHARNRGIEAASGDVCLFCDADDLIASDWIEAHLAALAGSDASVGACHYMDTRPLDAQFQDRFPPQPMVGDDPWVITCNFACTRRALQAVDGFDERLLTLEDLDIGLRLARAGFQLIAAPEAKLLRRRRDSTRGEFRRSFRYGRGFATLASTYPDFPIRIRPLQTLRSVLLRLPILTVSGRHRQIWLARVARDAGYLRGAWPGR